MRKLPVVAPIENLATARFECVFPVCGGICCKNGRPPAERAEEAKIRKNIRKFLPHLRPKARKLVEARGFMTKRVKEGLHTLAVSEGWCVFENGGCVLHKVGAEEGEAFRYKPWRCVAFPIEVPPRGAPFVRQHGLHGEAWDLFCLNPDESPKVAKDTIKAEAAFVGELFGGKEAWRGVKAPAPETPAPSTSRKKPKRPAGR